MGFKGTVMENCPFCGRQGIAKNPQGVAVCVSHKNAYLELKCVCGEPLDVMKGKYGAYGNCFKCGNMSLKKALELNDVMKPMPTNTASVSNTSREKTYGGRSSEDKPKNIVVRSDDPDYFD